MYGAMIGDIAGSKYEFHNIKTKDFPLFSEGCDYTDDTIVTVAVAKAILLSREARFKNSGVRFQKILVETMQDFGRRYPNPTGAYGGNFAEWLRRKKPKPYGSYGNGSAMRVSPCGLAAVELEEALAMARAGAAVTHDHPEGIKGAEATACAIFFARTGYTKEEIKDCIQTLFDYDLSRTCDEIRPTYHHMESCQETVPEAITAFLEGESFEDVIRTAVSLGGDCDTLTCIAGSMAEGFYGVPEDLKQQCRQRLPGELLAVLQRFDAFRESAAAQTK